MLRAFPSRSKPQSPNGTIPTILAILAGVSCGNLIKPPRLANHVPTAPLIETPDPIDLARKAGLAQFHAPGGLWMPEMEIAFILRSLRRATCDDNKYVRLRRHLYAEGPPGTTKTTMGMAFLRDFCDAVPYESVDHGNTDKPTFAQVDGGGVSWEALRGGAVEGNLVYPSLQSIDYIFAGEMKSFLGEGESMRKRVQSLNVALEEGRIVLAQLGLANVKESRKTAFAQMCHDLGDKVDYNQKKNIISYNAFASMSAFSTPLGAKEEKHLKSTGFRSRFFHCPWEPSASELAAYLEDPFGPPDAAASEALLKFNRYLWSCRFKKIPAPSYPMMGEILKHYHRTYRKISASTGVSVAELANPRDSTDAFQLLVAFSVIRHIRRCMDAGDPPGEFATIDYTEEDVRAVKRFRIGHLAQVEHRAMKEAVEDESRDKAQVSLVAYLKHLGTRPTGDLVRTIDLVNFFIAGCPAGDGKQALKAIVKPSAYNRYHRMCEIGYLSPTGASGMNLVADSILIDAGIISSDDLLEERLASRERGSDVDDIDDGAPTREESLAEVEPEEPEVGLHPDLEAEAPWEDAATVEPK